MAGVELLLIDADTTARGFTREIRQKPLPTTTSHRGLHAVIHRSPIAPRHCRDGRVRRFVPGAGADVRGGLRLCYWRGLTEARDGQIPASRELHRPIPAPIHHPRTRRSSPVVPSKSDVLDGTTGLCSDQLFQIWNSETWAGGPAGVGGGR